MIVPAATLRTGVARCGSSYTGGVDLLARTTGPVHSRRVLDLDAAAGALRQPFTSADARPVGLTPDVLARGVRRGLLIRLAHGTYLLARVCADAGLRGQRLLRVAVAASQRPCACVTHPAQPFCTVCRCPSTVPRSS